MLLLYILASLIETNADPNTAVTLALIGMVTTIVAALITTTGLVLVNKRTDRNSTKTQGNTTAIESLADDVVKLRQLIKEIVRDADRYEGEAEAHIDEWEIIAPNEKSRLTTRRPARRLRFVEGE